MSEHYLYIYRGSIMLKKKLIALSFVGALCGVASNVFATDATKPEENISHTALDACKESKEADSCMYIENDTKFTGTCQKHEDKLKCTPIKS